MSLSKKEIEERILYLSETASATQKGMKYPKEIEDFASLSTMEVKHLEANGVPFKVYCFNAKDKETNAPLFINIHGGSYYIPFMNNDLYHGSWLADKIKGVVLSIDYSTSDIVPYDGMLDQCYETARYAFAHAKEMGCDINRISIGGFSAGGHLTAGVVVKNCDTEEFHFAGQVICYAPLNMNRLTSEMAITKRNQAFHDLAFRKEEQKYINDPYCNVYNTPDEKLAKMPRTLVITADACGFTNENNQYANRLALQHVDVMTAHFGKSKHGYIPHFTECWLPASNMIAEFISTSYYEGEKEFASENIYD